MELLQLRYFFETAKSQNIAKTAEKYMVPASSVSASIKRLESELGCKLFDRTANSIVLNDKGAILMESLISILGELDHIVDSISSDPDDTREIRILVKALRTVITDHVIKYKIEHAATRFKLISDFDVSNLDHYDIIVDTRSDFYREYESIELCTQRIFIYASSHSPLCGRKLSLKQLKNQPFACMGLHGNQYRVLQTACNQAGFVPNLVAQINDSGCFKSIIRSGVAIGAAGEVSIKLENDATIVPLNISDFKATQTVCAYFKKESAYGNVSRFIEYLKNSI